MYQNSNAATTGESVSKAILRHQRRGASENYIYEDRIPTVEIERTIAKVREMESSLGLSRIYLPVDSLPPITALICQFCLMVNYPNLTVMGPGVPDYPRDNGSMLDARRLNSKTEKSAYRRNVRMLYECVQSAAESGYAITMGSSRNLGHALFTRVDQRYKRILHSAIDNGSFILRTHQDGSKFTDQEHISCVENILNLVAKETTAERVKRLIRMTREVHNCKREASESFADYAVRFENISRAYLSIAKAWPNLQDEQNFAIMAIENPNLLIATYNAIISNLVNHAKDSVRLKLAQVPVDTIQTFIADINKLVQRLTSVSVEPQDNNYVAIQDVKQMSKSLHI